jgi:glycosyltransferase involved in cell wall biosynthesis
VRVLTNRYPVKLPRQDRIDGVVVDRLLFLEPSREQLRSRRFDLFGASLFVRPQTDRRFTKLVNDFKPDAVNVHFANYGIPSLLRLQQRLRFRLVVSLHGYDVNQFVQPDGHESQQKKDRLQAILKAADAVTCVSEDLLRNAKSIEPLIAEKSSVIPNGVDANRFAAAAPYMHPRPYILALGRLVQAKGLDMLIDAFANCDWDDKPDLIVAGSGEERQALQKQVSRLGLTDRVHFFGEASAEDAARLMIASSAVAVPSRSESFGLVALEALAARKPLLATEVGGLRELIAPVLTGLNGQGAPNGKSQLALVRPSADAIAEGLKRIFPPVTLAHQKDYVLPKRFEWKSVAAAYEQVLIGN